MKGGNVIWWIRNDLRIQDNNVLQQAIKSGKSVIPFYCFERSQMGRQARTWHYNYEKCASHRVRFTIEGVEDLKNNLKKIHNVEMVIRVGDSDEEMRKICELVRVDEVYTLEEVCYEEIQQEAKVEKILKLRRVWDSTLYHSEDLPYEKKKVPLKYTQFRKDVEARWKIRPVVEIKEIPQDKSVFEKVAVGDVPKVSDFCDEIIEEDARAVLRFRGGETAALQRLRDYLWGSKSVQNYKETRNGMVGADYSTKFSAWLAQGSLSGRMVYWELQRFEEKVVKNDSTYWVVFELLWRDYFKFLSVRVGNSLFYLNGPMNVSKPWVKDEEGFRRWTTGTTGYPIVDANMRELKSTGFMSNRGRQIVASFLTKDLGIDWRRGAEWFESLLIDHDPSANYGNWTYSAGVGVDPRDDRYFSIPKQSQTYDPDGIHARLWIPELKNVPKNLVHNIKFIEPHQAQKFGMGEYGDELYPKKLAQYAPKQNFKN